MNIKTFTATILDPTTTPGELVIEIPVTPGITVGGPYYIRIENPAGDQDADTAAAIDALDDALEAENLTWADDQEPTATPGQITLTNF